MLQKSPARPEPAPRSDSGGYPRNCYSLEVADNLKLLLRLWWQPASAMSAILDQGSLLFASLAVLAVSLLLQAPSGHTPPWFTFTFYAPLLVLAVVYVPGTLLL